MEYVILGLLNGCCITLSRVLNGQLSKRYGVLHASFVNHLVGFLFLSLLFTVLSEPWHVFPTEPSAYSGGLIGALYVAINSVVMVRLGSTNSIVMVVAGQMLFGLVVEIYYLGSEQIEVQILGALFLVVGVLLKGRLAFHQTASLSQAK